MNEYFDTHTQRDKRQGDKKEDASFLYIYS